jgi:hypothetical protein
MVFRRRRSRRHERNRRIRRVLLITTCAGVALVLACLALTYLSPSLFRASSHRVASDALAAAAAQNAILQAQQQSLRHMQKRPVYPYSVVAGGVEDIRELKWAAEHDPVVGAHYAGFDYTRARVIRLLLTRSVYLSYRIGNRVYWTRHRVKLKKGETLITDGKMTARTRCANRVEEKPQQESSKEEPPVARFDEPVRPALGTAIENPAAPVESALNRPPVPGLGPTLPLGVYDPIQGGTFTPIAPPPLPSVCGISPNKKPKEGGTAIPTTGKGKRTINPCETGGISEVPEPGTWLLVGSGLTLMLWKFRQSFARS